MLKIQGCFPSFPTHFFQLSCLLPSSFFSLNPFFTLLVSTSFLKLSSFWVSMTPPDFPPTSSLSGCSTSSILYLKMFSRISYLAFLSSFVSRHVMWPHRLARLHKQPLKVISKRESLPQSSQPKPKHLTLFRTSFFGCVPQALQINCQNEVFFLSVNLGFLHSKSLWMVL